MTDENGNIQYRLGIPEEHRQCAAALYDEAFGAKFSVAISSKEKRIALISSGLNLNFGVCAIQGHQLVSLAGFHTGKGSLTAGITYRSLLAQLGFLKETGLP